MDKETVIRTTEASVATATVEAPADAPVTEWKEPPPWLPRTFQALAYRDYTFLFLAQITNSLAMWMDMVARPILVLMLTGSAIQMGLIVAVRGVPMMFLQPLAGVVADRFDRRLVILWSKASSMIVNFAFAIIILSGQLELWHIYFTAVLRSLLMAFDSPARNALLPSLVPTRLLVNAVALNSGSMQLARTISAAIAGFSIFGFGLLGTRLGIGDDYFGVGSTYLLAAAFYVTAVTLTYMLHVPPGGRVVRSEENWVTSLVDGIRFARNNPAIFGILILLGVRSIFGMPYMSVFIPLIVYETMDFSFLSVFGASTSDGQSAMGVGLMGTASGVGGLLGTIFIATIGDRLHHKGLWILGSQLAFGVGLVGLGLSALLPTVLVAFGLMIVVGVGQAIVMPVKNAVLLEESPNEMRGRVLGLQGLDRGFATLGGMFSGFIAAALGGPIGLAVFGGLCVVATIGVAGILPGLRKVD